jgi:hypothetical protein
MGKMKQLAMDMMEQQQQNVKTYPLSSIIEDTMSIDEHQEDLEEAHYVHTMNDFVELIIVYGYDKVIGDLRTAMGNKTW